MAPKETNGIVSRKLRLQSAVELMMNRIVIANPTNIMNHVRRVNLSPPISRPFVENVFGSR